MRSNIWTEKKEKKFNTVCKIILGYYSTCRLNVNAFCKLRETKPKLVSDGVLLQQKYNFQFAVLWMYYTYADSTRLDWEQCQQYFLNLFACNVYPLITWIGVQWHHL